MERKVKNYYEILEVDRKASSEVIEKAYKTLVKKYHPDLQENEKQEEKQVERAQEIIKEVIEEVEKQETVKSKK